ncbi:uncharacterized protein LOC119726831 [Patiria miniata]|uniref:Integrase catalytic domain-containing protein n=1 Tax=Patiria miniata TaxID=46514 RepID=A0A913ZU62_PATMI|nr:uncharacterized protein LOC119726831 [Patiria miniata]
MTEMFNRTLLSMLGTLEPTKKVDWAMYVESMTHAYNSTRHDSTGYSPFHLMFLRGPRLPADLIIEPVESPDTAQADGSHHGYVQRLKRHMLEAYQQVNTAATKARMKQKVNYDKKVREAPVQLGSKLLVANKTPRGKGKLRDNWEEIPYVVIRKLQGFPVYTVRQMGSRKTRTLHRDIITACPFDVPEEESKSTRPEEIAEAAPTLSHSKSEGLPGDCNPNTKVSTEDEPLQSGTESSATRQSVPDTASEYEASDESDSSSTDDEPPPAAYNLRRNIKFPNRLGNWCREVAYSDCLALLRTTMDLTSGECKEEKFIS